MSERVLYKCVNCLSTFNEPPASLCPVCNCDHVLEVHVGEPGSESTKPVVENGKVQTHAPRWWVFRDGPYGRRI
jgi:hypothetical protein